MIDKGFRLSDEATHGEIVATVNHLLEMSERAENRDEQFLTALSGPRNSLTGQRASDGGLVGEVKRLTTQVEALAKQAANGVPARVSWTDIAKILGPGGVLYVAFEWWSRTNL